MKIGLAQMNMAWENKEANFKKAEKYMIEAAEKEVDFLVFPEMSMTGFSMHVERIGETKENLYTRDYFAEFAKKYGMYIGIGYVENKNERGLNRYAVLSPEGEVLCDYVKIHPFTYGREGEYYDSGSKVGYAQVGDFCVSPLICYDLRFADVFQQASGKPEMFVIAASWPEPRMEAWEVFLKARAMEYQSILVGINRTGFDGKIPYIGKSMVIGADGRTIGGPFLGEGVFTVDVELDEVLRERNVFPTAEDRKAYAIRMMGIGEA